jgi:hypothetical protein
LAVPLRSRKLASEKGIEPGGFRWIAVPQIGLKRFITTWNTTHMHQLDVTAFRDQRTDAVCEALGPNKDQRWRSSDDCPL